MSWLTRGKGWKIVSKAMRKGIEGWTEPLSARNARRLAKKQAKQAAKDKVQS